MNIVKLIIRKLILGHKSSSEEYIKFLKKKGCRIGRNTIIFSPTTVIIDITRPYLIEIGDNVKITHGVTILTHGYDWSVLRFKYHELLGSAGKVKIGDNVFIGMNTTILKGVEIGNNVIIGANSLVNKDIPSDVVVAGNPMKIIMTLDEYYKKRSKEYIEEAKECAKEIYIATGKIPQIKDFKEFFPLFVNRDRNELKKYKFTFKHDEDEGEVIEEKFLNSQPIYKSFEEFLKDCEL